MTLSIPVRISVFSVTNVIKNSHEKTLKVNVKTACKLFKIYQWSQSTNLFNNYVHYNKHNLKKHSKVPCMLCDLVCDQDTHVYEEEEEKIKT